MSMSEKVEVGKTFAAEWFSIFRKYKLYKDIRWTKEQQQEFDTYWKVHYGKKISNRWHRLYQSMNGVFCVEYIPEILYSTKIEPKWNRRLYCKVYADKALTETLYSDKIAGVRTPITYLVKDEQAFYGTNRAHLDYIAALNLLSNIGDVVIKPTVDSSSGKGVRILKMCDGIDEKTGDTAEKIMAIYKKNYLVQEKIISHSKLSKIYPDAVNTIRFITYLSPNGVSHAPISLRIGSGGSEVDNIHAGGMVVAVDENGVLSEKAYRLGYGDNNEFFTAHPDTGLAFEGYKLPFMDRIRDAAYALHVKTPNVGMISWDFTVNDKDEIIVVEANYIGQSIWFPQIINKTGFFGNDAAYVLECMKDSRR